MNFFLKLYNLWITLFWILYKSYVILSYAWTFYMDHETKINSKILVHICPDKNTYFIWKCGSLFAPETYPKPVWEPKYPKCLCILEIFVYFGYVFGIHIFLSFWFEFPVIVWILNIYFWVFRNNFGYCLVPRVRFRVKL